MKLQDVRCERRARVRLVGLIVGATTALLVAGLAGLLAFSGVAFAARVLALRIDRQVGRSWA